MNKLISQIPHEQIPHAGTKETMTVQKSRKRFKTLLINLSTLMTNERNYIDPFITDVEVKKKIMAISKGKNTL